MPPDSSTFTISPGPRTYSGPTGMSIGSSWASRVEVRTTGAGLSPNSMLISFSLRAIWPSTSGMVAATERSASLARETSSFEARPLLCWSSKSLNVRSYESRVRLAIASCSSSSNKSKYALATALTTEIMTARRPSWVAMKFARAASFIRRTRPHRSISQSASKPAKKLSVVWPPFGWGEPRNAFFPRVASPR
jgi:hypothetical protein